MADNTTPSSQPPSHDFVVGIIDGTGPEGDADYKKVMADGFCKQFETVYKNTVYRRGPSTDGSGLQAAVTDIFQSIQKQHGVDGQRDIALIGYSRGGLGVLQVAHMLKKQGVDVHTLVLLDPVDRYGASWPYPLVPNNVKASFRAYRQLSASVVLKYEGTIPTDVLPSWVSTRIKAVADSIINLFAPSNPFRPSFSSTALGVERGGYYSATDPLQHIKRSYVGSHGAMGGVGYTWIAEDATCQAQLISDLTKWLALRLEGKIVLKAGYDPILTKARVGGVLKVITTMGAAKFDMALLGIERLDALISRLREMFSSLGAFFGI